MPGSPRSDQPGSQSALDGILWERWGLGHQGHGKCRAHKGCGARGGEGQGSWHHGIRDQVWTPRSDSQRALQALPFLPQPLQVPCCLPNMLYTSTLHFPNPRLCFCCSLSQECSSISISTPLHKEGQLQCLIHWDPFTNPLPYSVPLLCLSHWIWVINGSSLFWECPFPLLGLCNGCFLSLWMLQV